MKDAGPEGARVSGEHSLLTRSLDDVKGVLDTGPDDPYARSVLIGLAEQRVGVGVRGHAVLDDAVSA